LCILVVLNDSYNYQYSTYQLRHLKIKNCGCSNDVLVTEPIESNSEAIFVNPAPAITQQTQNLAEWCQCGAMVVLERPTPTNSKDHCVDPDSMHHGSSLRNRLALRLVHAEDCLPLYRHWR
jgi:hypothetical protein